MVQVDTPIGPYNPDWAILVTKETDKLYLVRETKGTLQKDELRKAENDKIDCGRRHFKAIDVDYEVTTSLRETMRAL